MAKDLSSITLTALLKKPPVGGRRETPDGKIRGLYFVQQSTGAASWAFRYRSAGRPRKLTIGPYPKIDMKSARDLASEAAVSVAKGGDPAADKKAARVVARFPADRELVEKVAATFIERHARKNTREASWRETERLLNKEVVARWKGRTLGAIRRPDVHDLLDNIVDRGAPIVANRTLAALRRMCSWAVERGLIDSSPCENVKAPAAERSRDRVLSDAEIALLWRAAGDIHWPFGPIVRMLLLTGQRREEVAAMRWSEVSVETRTWTIPKERAKNGVEHTVPLSTAALAILEALPRIKGRNDFVFSVTGTTRVSGFARAKTRLDRAISARARGTQPVNDDHPPISPWTFHDLRRTMASGMARLGIALPVIEKILNHVSGSFGGIVGVYQRHSFADEKRAALETWGQFIEALVSEKTEDNVVAIESGRSRSGGAS